MARFKPIHKGLELLPVDFDRQVIPGSFEYALCHLVDHELDLSTFHARYKNDVEGASAFDPAVLIKIILLAYSRGIIHSRKIEAACRENLLFIAVSGDSQPHFTTLAAFVSNMGDQFYRFPLGRRSLALRLPRRKASLQQWIELHDQWVCGAEV